MTQKEISARIYRNRKKNGLCPTCGATLDRKGHYCSACLHKRNEEQREARKYYLSIGVCPVCKKEKLVGDEKQCITCRLKAKEYREKHVYPNQKQYADRHKTYLKELYKVRAEKGICTRCGKRKAEPGKKKCAICQYKENEYKRLKNKSNDVITKE